MTPYLILSRNAPKEASEALVQRVRAIIDTPQSDWRLLTDHPAGLIAVGQKGRVIAAPREVPATFIIGDIFPRVSSQEAIDRLLAAELPFPDLCRALARDWWGAYLAVQIRGCGDMSLFRDPVGMGDGLCWDGPGGVVFASQATPWLAASTPPGLAIDWTRIAQLLRDSSTVAEATPLAGIETIPAGSLVDLSDGRQLARRLWVPRMFDARRALHDADVADLREVIIRCMQAWVATYPDNMLEMSGGFDSAVVAAAGTLPAGRIKRGVNFFADHLSGDERRYARDVSARRAIPLDEIFMPIGRLSEADLDDGPVDVRPGLSTITLFHDRPLARIAADHGATALFTGHGGDSLFFQHPTPMIAADRSFPRSDIRAYAALAKWSRESMWTVAGHAFGLPLLRQARLPENDAIVALPISGDVRVPVSEWAGDTHGLSPAKRLQIAAIATDRSVVAPSWRSRALTVVHPLLSQPVVEWAIATDVFALTEGKRDRALARKAFAADLPASIVERMGKGVLAHFFGRCLCASVPFLRTFLLDGLLVRHGVIDTARLEPMLECDYLMRFDCYAKLRSAIIMEHWARVWQGRLDAMRSNGMQAFAAAAESGPAT
jgi:asparagine synthase (glutamine-hydrolysing)